MKKLTALSLFLISIFILSSCDSGDNNKDNQSSISNSLEIEPDIEAVSEEIENQTSSEEIRNSIFNLTEIDFSDISINTNTYSNLSITINNTRDYDIVVNIPSGSLFDNLVEDQQDLINLTNSSMNIMSNSSSTIELETACVDPNKASPSTNNLNIFVEIPDNLLSVHQIPDFFEKYDTKLIWIDKMRKNKIFNTEESKRHFQQMVIWLMLDTDKSTMTSFMSQYVYEGDYNRAESFINKYYDEAVKIRDVYRDYKITGRINWSDVKDLTKEIDIPTKSEIKDVIEDIPVKNILRKIL